MNWFTGDSGRSSLELNERVVEALVRSARFLHQAKLFLQRVYLQALWFWVTCFLKSFRSDLVDQFQNGWDYYVG